MKHTKLSNIYSFPVILSNDIALYVLFSGQGKQNQRRNLIIAGIISIVLLVTIIIIVIVVTTKDSDEDTPAIEDIDNSTNTSNETAMLPVPGIPFIFTIGGILQNLTVNENVIYSDNQSTVQCIIEFDENGNLDSDLSFIQILDDLSGKYKVGSIIVATSNVFNELHANCTAFPAVIVTQLYNDTENGILTLNIKEAELFDYLDEMDVNITNGTLFDAGVDIGEIRKLQNLESYFTNYSSNINQTSGNITFSNVSYTEYLLLCNNGSNNLTVIDGLCDGINSIDYYGTSKGTDQIAFGDNIFQSNNTDYSLPINSTRRRLGLFRRFIEKVVKVVKVVVDVVKTTIDILRGDIDKRLIEIGLRIDPSHTFKIEGEEQIDYGKLSGSVNGKFSINAGVDFFTGVYVDLVAKYKIFSLNPSFDYFLLKCGGETRFKAFIDINIEGSVDIRIEIARTEQRRIFMLGPIPVVIKPYAAVSIGLETDLDISFAAEYGYKPIFIEYGIEWTKENGWKSITNKQLQFIPYKNFGGDLGDDNKCIDFIIEPYIELQIGIVFYEIVDVSIIPRISIVTNLQFPATCTNIDACLYDPLHTRFNLEFEFTIYIGLSVGLGSIGLPTIDTRFPLSFLNIPSITLFDQCFDTNSDLLSTLCCTSTSSNPSTMPTTSEPTQLPTTDDPTMRPTAPPQIMNAMTINQTQRIDYVEPDGTIISDEKTNGVFGGRKFCEQNQWVNRYLYMINDMIIVEQIHSDLFSIKFRRELAQGLADDAAGVGVALMCKDPSNTSTLYRYEYRDYTGNDNVGNWVNLDGAGDCGDGYMVGFKTNVENQCSFDCTALNCIQIKCSNGDILEAQDCTTYGAGYPDSFSECPSGSYVCGWNERFQEYQGSNDDTALNAVRFECCHFGDSTNAPTAETTINPTETPTLQPSTNPTLITISPTISTDSPTINPSISPSENPTLAAGFQTYGPYYYPTGSNSDPVVIQFGEVNSTHMFIDIFSNAWFGFGFADSGISGECTPNSGCTENIGAAGCTGNGTAVTGCRMYGVDAVIFANFGGTLDLTVSQWTLGDNDSGNMALTQELEIVSEYSAGGTYQVRFHRAFTPADRFAYPVPFPFDGDFCWLWAIGNDIAWSSTKHAYRGYQCIDDIKNYLWYQGSNNEWQYAMNGYDVVEYFNLSALDNAVPGDDLYTSTAFGIEWRFKDQVNKDLFDANPTQYVPAYGGYGAFAMSTDGFVLGDPDAWSVYNGRLYICMSKAARSAWSGDKDGNIASADLNWANKGYDNPH